MACHYCGRLFLSLGMTLTENGVKNPICQECVITQWRSWLEPEIIEAISEHMLSRLAPNQEVISVKDHLGLVVKNDP
jgi:hypothetical protein